METRRTSARIHAKPATVTQSSRRKPAAKARRRAPVVIDTFEDPSSASDGDDSEYGRPRKRAKKSRKDRKGRNSEAKLSLLPTMPLDILFEILSRLSPKDLVALADVSKAFRDVLLSHSSSTVWKTARAELDIQAPMPRYSEYRWAQLLFGPPKCEICGCPGVRNIDFGLRKRVCHRCCKRNLIARSKWTHYTEFEFFDIELLDLLPYSNSNHLPYDRPTRGKYYWKDDIYYINDELGKLEHDISLRRSNAAQRRDEFIAQRKKFVEDVRNHVTSCQQWADRVIAVHDGEVRERKNERRKEIKRRLLLLNYKSVDIDMALWEFTERETQVTEKGWIRMLPRFQEALKHAQRRRLNGNSTLLASRRRIADAVISSFIKTLPHSQWISFPSNVVVYDCPEFDEVIYSEEDVEVTEESFSSAVAALAERASEWTKMTLIGLRHSLGSFDQDIMDTRLDLAASVWVCCAGYECSWRTRHALITAEGVFRHHCPYPPGDSAWIPHAVRGRLVTIRSSQKSYDPALSAAAACLVRLAGLDPDTATAREMDKLASSFLVSCTRCPRFGVYSWRGFMDHILGSHNVALKADEVSQLIYVLTPEEREQVDIVPPDDLDWTCGHCNAFYDGATKAHIEEHVLNEHGILEPEEPRDLFLRPGVQPPYPLVSSNIPVFLCQHCPNSDRQFTINGAKQHFDEKHDIDMADSALDETNYSAYNLVAC